VTGREPSSMEPRSGTEETRPGPRKATILLSQFVPLLLGGYLLLTSTMAVIPGIWPYDAKRVIQFGLLLVLFALPLFNSAIRSGLGRQLAVIPGWLKLTLLALAGAGAASSLVNAESAMHAANSLSEVALMSTLVLSVFVVAVCRRIAGRSFDYIAIGLLALTGLAVGIQELLGVLAAHTSGLEFTYILSLLNYSHPRFYNQVQSWMIPVLTVIPILFARHGLARLICLMVLGLQWYIILMTGARGAFVSIAGAFGFAVIFFPLLRKHLLTWQLAGFIFGALIYVAALYSFDAHTPDIQDAANHQPAGPQTGLDGTGGFYGNEDGTKSGFFAQSLGRPMTNTSGRSWMWKITIRDTRAHPLLGIGPMNYVCTKKSVNLGGHPHNLALQIAAEWGLPAALAAGFLFLFLCAAATRYWRARKSTDQTEPILGSLLLTGIVSASLYSCLSGVMIMPASQVTGVLLGGMLLGLVPIEIKDKVSFTARSSFIPGMLLSGALLALAWYELSTLDSRAGLLRPADNMHPRMWQNAMVCKLYNVSGEVRN